MDETRIRPWPKPSIADVSSAIARELPQLAGEPLSFLSEGWDFLVYDLGDNILRWPQHQYGAEALAKELKLLPGLAPALPAPIPAPLHSAASRQDAPAFAVYRKVPGIALRDLGRRPSDDFGAQLGRFLKALHAFPVDQALNLGLKQRTRQEILQERLNHYEQLRRRVFPLISEEIRIYAEERFQESLDQFAFDESPLVTVHGDIDDRNVLVNPETGDLSGVIDFGDAGIGSSAADFTWAYAGGFAQFGIEDQLDMLIHEGGVDEALLRERPSMVSLWFPLGDILHGLVVEDNALVEDGLRRLNQAAARTFRD